MSYDPHCEDLAALFLSDEPMLKGREAELAQYIQHSIEEWIAFEHDLVEQHRAMMMREGTS